jgi:hypothetical protein
MECAACKQYHQLILKLNEVWHELSNLQKYHITLMDEGLIRMNTMAASLDDLRVGLGIELEKLTQ